MTAATPAELIQQVLEELSVVAGGEPVSPEDSALVTKRITSVNEELRELEICYWTDAAFPQAIKNALAMYVACACAGPLYPGNPEYAQAFVRANKKAALDDLRRLTSARERVDTPTKAIYY